MFAIAKLAPALATGFALIAVASPATAQPRKDKPVIVSAKAVPDATSRICMPRSMSKTVGRDKAQPVTLCQTVGEWATHGVTIVVK